MDSKNQSSRPAPKKELRLWPGITAVILLWLARFGLKEIIPGFEGFEAAITGGFAASFLVIVWWLFFSRADHLERWGAFVLMAVMIFVTWNLNHESMGPLWLAAYALPFLFLAFVVWAFVTRKYPNKVRRITMAVTIILSCTFWLFIRSAGIDGDHVSDFSWRWSESVEESLLTEQGAKTAAAQSTEAAAGTEPEWPGFRGPERSGVISGLKIETDWSASPPVELWRRPVGAGWSSFAVHGDYIYTQEQRGEIETVSCFHKPTGKLIWKHGDEARFFESNGGAGPRATPALFDGKVFSLGAEGNLNVLHAGNGSVVWSRNAAQDAGANIPMWGFSASPVIADSMVINALSGSLTAHDIKTGEPVWHKKSAGDCYSSPHLLTIGITAQIVFVNDSCAAGINPSDGTILWEHKWPGHPIVQPALTANGDILISVSERSGLRRLSVKKEEDTWTVTEQWTSAKIKPYFNDFVIHKGHAYGLSGRRIVCVNLKDGSRCWKGKNYGGQLVLLAEQDLLLVLSEKGSLALVQAVPDKFSELAKFKALEGKTWNHPVIAGGILLVRNAEEMAAFKLPLFSDDQS